MFKGIKYYVATGFEITIPNENKIYCRVLVAAFTCDLPARAMVMNMYDIMDFMGAHCKQKG